jgi:Na+-transporting NADH:ubiquinone oxidoreductase subunit NqrF
MSAVTLTGWYVGYVIAAVVIVLVVILVAVILSQVRKIGQQAAAVVDVLDDVRKNTTSIPAVATLNQALLSVVQHAATARKALGG